MDSWTDVGPSPSWQNLHPAAVIGRLRDALESISHKILTDTLRRAECEGVVTRHVDPGRVETATLYLLTDLGESLDEPLAALDRWAEANWTEVEVARREWSHRNA